MPLYFKTVLVHAGALGLIGLALLFLATFSGEEPQEFIREQNVASLSPLVSPSTTPITIVTSPIVSTSSTKTVLEEKLIAKPKKANPTPATPTSAEIIPESGKVTRIENPYPFPPTSFDTINTEARAALVNILCLSTGGKIKSITGSGVIIDSRGVILTNAHVAQFVLLSERSAETQVTCTIRQGSPAKPLWNAEILYIPPNWVTRHAGSVIASRPTGDNGEQDYALLRITSGKDASAPLPQFPALPFDTREKIGFVDDEVLTASYPAEFLMRGGAQSDLYPLSSITTIKELLTFREGTVDVISIGSTPGAQGGSSGGAFVNAWGHVVGVITTTTEGKTTGDRDLRGLTISYINRDLEAQTGLGLTDILKGDIKSRAATFNSQIAPALIDAYLKYIAENTI